MPQNLGNLLKSAGIEIPQPKNTGPLTGPLRPSMDHRITIARLRREIKSDHERNMAELEDGQSVSSNGHKT